MNEAQPEQQLIIPVALSGVDISHTNIGPKTPFFRDMASLIGHLEPYADQFLLGTNTQFHLLNKKQREWAYHAVTTKFQDSPGQKIPIIAGILWSDETIAEQVKQAQGFSIRRFALGLNHTGDNETRVQKTLDALGPNDTLMLYNMPGFDAANMDDVVRWVMSDSRIIGFKDSSAKEDIFIRLLLLARSIPGFQLFHGSEAGWGKLTPEQRKQSAGLISGTANVRPALLKKFMADPASVAEEYDSLVAELSQVRQPFNTDIRGGGIQSYVHNMLKMLIRDRVFQSYNSATMYSEPGKIFFL